MEHEEFSKVELRTMLSAWRALARRWDLSPRERRAILPEGGENDADPPQDTEKRMRVLIAVGYRIGMPEDMLHDWLRMPNMTLGWLTPLDVMSGSLGELRGFRRLVEEGFAS